MSTYLDVYGLAEKLTEKQPNELNQRIHTICKNFINFPPLEVIEIVSALFYEKEPCENRSMVFIVDTVNRECLTVEFSEDSTVSFKKSNGKMIRKLLQPIPKDAVLVLEYNKDEESYKAIGVSTKTKLSKVVKRNGAYYKVDFIKYMEWTIELFPCKKRKSTKGISLLGYSKGFWMPFSKLTVQKEKDIEDAMIKIKSLFIGINDEKLKAIKEMLTCIYGREVGTSCIIFEKKEDAQNEAELFSKKHRAIKLQKASKFTHDMIKTILDIDGGVIFDAECKCYAYGCIYDGILTESFTGDISRGARHNSTKMYVANNHSNKKLGQHKGRIKPCVGIAFSEDGGIEIYPKD